MKFHEITSAQNDTFKMFKALLSSKGIVEHGQALLFGKKALKDVMKGSRDQVLGLLFGEGGKEDVRPLFSGRTYRLRQSLFDDLDIFGTKCPIAVVKVPDFTPWNPLSAEPGCYLYIPFQDPSNVGAVLRSAAAFGVKGILLSKGAAHPFHPRSSRAASGNLFQNCFFRLPEGLRESQQFPLFGLDRAGEPLPLAKFPKSFILVAGVEGPGLQAEIALSKKIGIPICDGVESLNAVVAASIVLCHWYSSSSSKK